MKVLIIGYGNTLRGDDGLGPFVVEEIAARKLPGIRTKVVFQLTPELAEELAQVDMAIFVDAGSGDGVHVDSVGDSEVIEEFTHAPNVQTILGLARTVFGHAPRTWVVSIAGSDFSFRVGLSPQGQENARRAVQSVVELVSCACV